MFKTVFLAGSLAAFAIPSAFADFSYEQTTKMTGGALAGMMKFAGAFNKQLREPMVSTVAVKGNRLANISRENINIIDIDKETITDINLKDRTYSVITFADMAAAMQKMMERVDKNAAAQADANVKVDVKETGQSKVVNGFPSKQFIITIDLEATDQKSGQSATMTTSSEMWLTPNIRGYDEVKNLYLKMAQKIAFTPGGLGMGMTMGRADLAKGFARAGREMAKLDGIPVMTVIRMGPKLTPEQQAELAKAQQQQANQPPPPSASEAAGQAAAGAAVGRMGKVGAIGGALGGFGGFGRKKKQQEEPQQQASNTPPPSAQAVSGAGALIEMTTEITSFSSAPVDDSKWSTAGMKEVEHPMKKAVR